MADEAILGVAVGASREAIKAAFRARALVIHPDKGGSHEAFVTLQEAFARLYRSPGGGGGWGGSEGKGEAKSAEDVEGEIRTAVREVVTTDEAAHDRMASDLAGRSRRHNIYESGAVERKAEQRRRAKIRRAFRTRKEKAKAENDWATVDDVIEDEVLFDGECREADMAAKQERASAERLARKQEAAKTLKRRLESALDKASRPSLPAPFSTVFCEGTRASSSSTSVGSSTSSAGSTGGDLGLGGGGGRIHADLHALAPWRDWEAPLSSMSTGAQQVIVALGAPRFGASVLRGYHARDLEAATKTLKVSGRSHLSTKEERIAALTRMSQDQVLRAVHAAMHAEVGDAPELLTCSSSAGDKHPTWAPKTRDRKAVRRERGSGGHRD
jgi:curved DNA-binding protein CbpA